MSTAGAINVLNTGLLGDLDETEQTEINNRSATAVNASNNKEIDKMPIDSIKRLENPTPLIPDEFNSLTDDKKMGKIFSKLNEVCLKVAQLDLDANHDTDGYNTRIATLQTQVDQDTLNIVKLNKENSILKGLVQRQFNQINELNDKVAMLTMRSMERNITISGLEGDIGAKEKCKENVIKFLKGEVEIDVTDEEILVAHRAGQFRKQQRRPRIMIIRCTFALKERILSNAKNLKDKKNSLDEEFYINKQLPEKITEQNREIRETVKEQKEKDKNLPTKDKAKIEIREKQVFFDGVKVKKHLQPPKPMELFPSADFDKLEKIKLSSSDVESDEGSDFQAYAFKTGQILEVQRAYRKVRALHPSATHVIGAYFLRSGEGYQDDGEFSAGHKLLKNMKTYATINTAVFVVRAYGGTKLGYRRHDKIQQVAKQAIERIGK